MKSIQNKIERMITEVSAILSNLPTETDISYYSEYPYLGKRNITLILSPKMSLEIILTGSKTGEHDEETKKTP